MSNPFCYVELNTASVSDAKAFYKKIFAWMPKEVPNVGGYSMFQAPNGVGGGIGPKQMAEAPNAWLPYVEVGDVKKTIAKAVAAGATAVVPFMDLGGGMGSIGVFIDPQGAALGVWAKGKQAPPPAKKKAAKKAAKKPAKKAGKKR
jgi:hypothetical protein